MRYVTILLVTAVLTVAAVGCKWSFGSNSESNGNVNNTDRSSSNRNSNSDDYDYASNSDSSSSSNSAKDMTPTTIDIAEMTSGSGDKDMEGRMVTVTGGVLEDITSTTLRIRGAYGGYAFYCNGDFSDYMSMADRVRSLAQSGKAPKATVKGRYKISSTGNGGELDPCVLTDIQR